MSWLKMLDRVLVVLMVAFAAVFALDHYGYISAQDIVNSFFVRS